MGFPDKRKLLRVELCDFWRHRDKLFVVGGFALFKGRVIVSHTLRLTVLEALHAAHQGVHGRQLQAVWWPGLAPAIKQIRAQYRVCNKVAPVLSQRSPTRPTKWVT